MFERSQFEHSIRRSQSGTKDEKAIVLPRRLEIHLPLQVLEPNTVVPHDQDLSYWRTAYLL